MWGKKSSIVKLINLRGHEKLKRLGHRHLLVRRYVYTKELQKILPIKVG